MLFGDLVLDTPELMRPAPADGAPPVRPGPAGRGRPGGRRSATGRTIAELLANLDRRPRLLAIDGPRGPLKATVFGRLVAELPGFGISEAYLGPADEVQSVNWFQAHTEGLERKSNALNAEAWAAETRPVPWIVADYCLDCDLLRSL